MLFWKYQRQVKDICRQLSFLMKHDSNMLITREMDFGGIGDVYKRQVAEWCVAEPVIKGNECPVIPDLADLVGNPVLISFIHEYSPSFI